MGPTSAIWCTVGTNGMAAPAMLAMRLDQTPQAMTTWSAWMVPLSVTTERTVVTPPSPSLVSMSSTSVLANTWQPTVSTASLRMVVPASSESTTDTVGL